MSFTTEEFPSTSYYKRDLREIVDYCREFEKTLNSYAEVIEQLQAAITEISGMQSDIADLQNATSDLDVIRHNISDLQTNVSDLIRQVSDLTIDMDSVYSYINGQLNNIRSLIEVNRRIFEGKLSGLQFDLTFNVTLLNNKLDKMYNELKELIEQIVPTDVYNRVAGVRLSLDDNNFNVYEDLRCGGLTNAELSEFGVSNDYIASIVLNNRDQAINLRARLKLHYLYSPVSGKRVSHANAISQAIVAFTTNNHAGATNQGLYDTMLADSKTNDDIGDYYTSNFGKYFWLVG